MVNRVHLKLNSVYYLLVLSEAIGGILILELPHVSSAVVLVTVAVEVVEEVVLTEILDLKILLKIKMILHTLPSYRGQVGGV